MWTVVQGDDCGLDEVSVATEERVKLELGQVGEDLIKDFRRKVGDARPCIMLALARAGGRDVGANGAGVGRVVRS